MSESQAPQKQGGSSSFSSSHLRETLWTSVDGIVSPFFRIRLLRAHQFTPTPLPHSFSSVPSTTYDAIIHICYHQRQSHNLQILVCIVQVKTLEVKEVDLLEREKKNGEREGVLKHMDVKVCCSPREHDYPNITPHACPVSAR
jgi:hypothetical protein